MVGVFGAAVGVAAPAGDAALEGAGEAGVVDEVARAGLISPMRQVEMVAGWCWRSRPWLAAIVSKYLVKLELSGEGRVDAACCLGEGLVWRGWSA